MQSRNHLTIVFGAIITGFLLTSVAHAQFSKIRRELKHCYKVDFIRVFYDTEGEHKIAIEDVNENRVPDQVEDVAKQTWAAHKIYVETLGFTAPLETDRYSKAKFLDIHFLSRKTLKLQGVAYDDLQLFKREMDEEGTRSICFDVSSGLQASSNYTPCHEYFHLIQNGATYFKNRWYTEGSARWAEHSIGKGGLGDMKYRSKGKWPQTSDNQAELFEMIYDSEFYLWNPLAHLDDRNGKFDKKDVSSVVQKLKYANGEKVLKDFKLSGAEFMREVLVELGKADDVAFEELGYKKWSESNQRSAKNSPYIYEAIMKVARNRGHKVGEFNVDND